MPKLGEMAQISRPFQVALLALAALVLVWFAALHRPGSSSSTVSNPPSATVSRAAQAHAAELRAEKAHGKATEIARSHGTASGEAKSHASATRVTTSHRTVTHTTVSRTTAAHATAAHSIASNSTAAHTTASHSMASHTTATHTTATHAAAAHTTAAHTTASHTTVSHTKPVPVPSKASEASTMQGTVAAELAQGKMVLLLFWNPHSSDDVAVHGQVLSVVHRLGRHVVLHTASPAQVNSFGSITQDIQVYQTPTLLIVNHSRQVTALTGYNDAFAIEQAIAEAHG
jgi:hypothetical protein